MHTVIVSFVCFSSFSLLAINYNRFRRGKATNCALLSLHCFSNSQTLITDTLRTSLSLTLCLSLSVFLIGVQHPPTSCQERAPSQSSQSANYCRRQAHAARTQSDIQNLPEGSATAAWWRRGQSGSNVGGRPPATTSPPTSYPLLRLHPNGSDKHGQLQAMGSRGEEQGGWGNVRDTRKCRGGTARGERWARCVSGR